MGNSITDKPTDKTAEAEDNRNPSTNSPGETITGDNGEKLTGYEAEYFAMNGSWKGEKEQVKKDLLRGQNGTTDIQKNTGRHNRGVSLNTASDHDQKEKEKYDKAMRKAISQAQKDLEQRMEELAQELDKVNKVLGAFDKLEDLIKNNKFDKDNAAHLLLLQQTGVTLEEVEGPGALEKTKEKRKPFEERREEIIKEAEGLVQEAADNNYSSKAISEFAEKITQTESAVGYDVAANREAPEVLKDIAGDINTGNLLDDGISSIASFASELEGLGEGISPQIGTKELRPVFAKATNPEPTPESKAQNVATPESKFTLG